MDLVLEDPGSVCDVRGDVVVNGRIALKIVFVHYPGISLIASFLRRPWEFQLPSSRGNKEKLFVP